MTTSFLHLGARRYSEPQLKLTHGTSVGWRSLHEKLGPLFVKCKGTVLGLRMFTYPGDGLNEYIAPGQTSRGVRNCGEQLEMILASLRNFGRLVSRLEDSSGSREL